MVQIIILIVILVFANAIGAIFWVGLKRKIAELSFKINKNREREEFLKIEFQDSSHLGEIAKSFNELGSELKELKKGSVDKENLQSEKSKLDSKLKQFENSLSNLNLITDIGKNIAGSLNIDEICAKMFQYINSGMIADEIVLHINNNGKANYLKIRGNSAEEIKNKEWCESNDNILNWCSKNNKEAILLDAKKDYGQYVFKQPVLTNGHEVMALIAVPLIHANSKNGALAVFSKQINAFETYHLDYLKSLASYVAVAIENANLYSELNDEKHKSDSLLLNILPHETAEELKKTGKTQPRQFKNVSVLFSDFKDFTLKSEMLSPEDLVKELDYCFGEFDSIILNNGIEKIKTIGDAYMCVSGLPVETQDHAVRIVKAAQEIRHFMDQYASKRKKEGKLFFELRIGINSGPVVAGVVGKSKFVYDVWGDTVNTATRMEQNCEAGFINISGSTYELVQNKFKCVPRGKIEAKNKGKIDMYYVLPQ